MDIIRSHLPKNCFSPRVMDGIGGVVIHYISAVNVQPNDPFETEAILKILIEYGFSAHYLIDRDGQVIELVPLPLTAYHAGRSIMGDKEQCNKFTVGIELTGGEHFDYTPDQIASCKHLLADLMTEYDFPIKNIQGHSEVREAWNDKHQDRKASIKVDPGPHFPWDDIKESLLGVSI